MTFDTTNVLQVLNGTLATVVVCAFFVFARYMFNNRHSSYEDLRPAIAMMSLCAAEGILRFPVFILRVLINAGYPLDQYMNIAYSVGGFVVTVGFLCIIRVFSPEKWGFWS